MGGKRIKLKMSQLLRIFHVLLIVIVMGSVLYLNYFLMRQIRGGEIEKKRILLSDMVNVWSSMADNNMLYINNYMAGNQDMVDLNRAESRADMIYALQNIRISLNEYAMLNNGMENIFFYAEKAGENGYLAPYRASSSSSKLLKQQIREMIDDCERRRQIGKWFIAELDGVNYVVYIKQYNNNYMGCWTTVDGIVRSLTADTRYGDEKGVYQLFITDQDGVSRTDSYLEGKQIQLNEVSYKDEESSTSYWQVVLQARSLPVYFIEHIERGAAEEGIVSARNLMIAMIIVLVISMLSWSGILEYMLYRPIRHLLLNMTQISEGNLDTRISEQSKLKEIQLLYGTFNNMAHELKHLKIAIYEKELAEQKAKLEYLQIQIHPHFLVNGLNSICTMIDMGKTLPAKKLCTHLAGYYQFQYLNHSGLIPLPEELEHAETYINIQKMRRPGKIHYHCEVEEVCRMAFVPPIMILTFVGNCFKYGMNLETFTHNIELTITKVENRTKICIRDDGPGFSEVVLEQIREGKPIFNKERECIGIQNAFSRLRLFFGTGVSYRAYNDSGAVVEIEITSF